jgi:protein O-mannosyl-transferase
MDHWLAKINKLTDWQVAIILCCVGFAVFFTGFATPFIGDDQLQIVNNPLVHSLSNIGTFFSGGTFYNAGGSNPLIGTYYRPLMTVAYSVLYTLLGPHTFPFHALQILICIASAFLLYLVFKYFFESNLMALFLALVFLVHPLNSMVAFAIPTLQDALFFFFGMLAFWLLLRYDSMRTLWLVAFCLFLSLLAKESGVLFVAVIGVYLFLFERKRLVPFVGIVSIPLVTYALLYLHAIGLKAHAAIAPIDSLSLVSRMLNVPAIILFYLVKFLFPLKLASGYFWTYTSLSFSHVIWPLVIDLAIATAVVAMGVVVRRKWSGDTFRAYVFFAAWVIIGLLIHLQIIPLDMTVAEPWFYFPMAGLLGLIGIMLIAIQSRINASWFVSIAVLLLLIFGIRTLIRGTDWSNEYTLATHDITASKEDYAAYSILAGYDLNKTNNYTEAKNYSLISVSIHPYFTNYYNLGLALSDLGDYAGAQAAYEHSLDYGQPGVIYENLGWLTLVYGSYNANKQILQNGLAKYPHDATLWTYLAILEKRNGHAADAKADIANAAVNGQVGQNVYSGIMNNQPFTVSIDTSGDTITVQ